MRPIIAASAAMLMTVSAAAAEPMEIHPAQLFQAAVQGETVSTNCFVSEVGNKEAACWPPGPYGDLGGGYVELDLSGLQDWSADDKIAEAERNCGQEGINPRCKFFLVGTVGKGVMGPRLAVTFMQMRAD